MVRKGDLLFRIDPRPLKASLNQAQANLGRDQAQLDKARLQLTRNQGWRPRAMSPPKTWRTPGPRPRLWRRRSRPIRRRWSWPGCNSPMPPSTPHRRVGRGPPRRPGQPGQDQRHGPGDHQPDRAHLCRLCPARAAPGGGQAAARGGRLAGGGPAPGWRTTGVRGGRFPGQQGGPDHRDHRPPGDLPEHGSPPAPGAVRDPGPGPGELGGTLVVPSRAVQVGQKASRSMW